MESKRKPKDYVIASGDAKLLSTDNASKALKKVGELMVQELAHFTLANHPAKTITTYQKERYQKNYRTTTKPIQ